ncbi:MAG: hypothetical protein R3B70_30325 [Polyangiaceae bacterium]
MAGVGAILHLRDDIALELGDIDAGEPRGRRRLVLDDLEGDAEIGVLLPVGEDELARAEREVLLIEAVIWSTPEKLSTGSGEAGASLG